MNLASWLKKLTTGKVVFETTSPINGKIQVVEDVFGRRLVVKGLTQSGGQVKRVWKEAVKEMGSVPSSLLRSFEEARKWEIPTRSIEDPRPTIGMGNCLIFGLGAGTLTQLISQKWPKVKITGVEIDPKIIEVGKNYFSLGKTPNLQIITTDAAKFLSTYHLSPITYHLIFVDLYLADRVPPQCETIDFLKRLKKLLAPKGLVVFNRLYYKDHKRETEIFLDKLEKVFHIIKRKKVGSNLLIFVREKQ